jgi:hypothetical protein
MTQKATQIPRDLQTIKFQINSALESEKKQSRKPSEILPTLLGCHKKPLLMKRRRPFGFKDQLEMADHVFADSLCLAFGLSPDLAVDVETCMSPL